MKTNIIKYGVEVFYTGGSIEQEIGLILAESAQKPVIFLFDLDGTLLESGLETENNPKTINDWANENQAPVRSFHAHIKKLRQMTGIHFGICTGRGLEFTERVRRALFPEDTLGESIVEGGIFINNFITGEKRYAKCMDKKSAALLVEYRQRIIGKVKAAGGFSEEGKELAVSLNPPGSMDIHTFKHEVISLIESLEHEILAETGKNIELINNLEINNSSTAIDITPKGASKLEALNEVSREKIAGYFGDAENDIQAMGESKMKATPANGVDKIKEMVRSADIGFIASAHTLEGVNQILRLINLWSRFLRITHQGINPAHATMLCLDRIL